MNGRRVLRWTGAVLAVAVASLPAVELRVVDADGETVPGARVAVMDVMTTTGDDGMVELPDTAGALWIKRPSWPPLEVHASSGGIVQLPAVPRVRVTVIERGTRKVVTAGTISWTVSGAPETLLHEVWESSRGVLELGWTEGTGAKLGADGFRDAPVRPAGGAGRVTVELAPGRTVRFDVPERITHGEIWLVPTEALGLVHTFGGTAHRYRLAKARQGIDLDGDRHYSGLLRAPGWAPLPFELPPGKLHCRLAPLRGDVVSGIVRDEEGGPVSGAVLEFSGTVPQRDRMPYRQRGVGDEKGAFLVNGLLPGKGILRACATGFACVERDVTVPVQEPVLFTLPRGMDVELVVLDQFGNPVRNTVAEVGSRCYQAGKDGVVTVPGVRPGAELEIFFSGGGVVPETRTVRVEGDRITVTLTKGARIEWPVLLDDRAAAEEGRFEWIEILPGGRENRRGPCSWDAERSSAVAEGLSAGRYRLRAVIPGYAPLTSREMEVAAGDDVVLAAAVPDPGVFIAGKVLDADSGEVVVGARVRAEPGDGGTFRTPKDLEEAPEDLSDGDGLFRVSGLEENRPYTVRVTASGYAERILREVVAESGGRDLGDVELDQGLSIAGVVAYRGGGRAGGATVELWEPGPYVFEPMRTIVADADGSFRFDRIPAGHWVLHASADEAHGKKEVEGETGDILETMVRIGGVRVEGEVWIGEERARGGHVVLVASGGARHGAVVVVTRADGTRVFGPGIGERHVTEVAPEGRFEFPSVEPGPYVASYSPEGSASMSLSVAIPDVDRFDLPLRFPDGGVEGVVVDPTGDPVNGAGIVLAGESLERHGVTGASGAFRIGGLRPGRYRLVASHSEYRDSEPVVVELQEGEGASDVLLQLRPKEGATLRAVLDPSTGRTGGAPMMLLGPVSEIRFADTAGIAVWEGLPSGGYHVCGRAFGGAVVCSGVLDLGENEERETSLSSGPGGYIRIPTAGSGDAGTVHLALPDGTALDSVITLTGAFARGDDGIFLGPLAEGAYVVSGGAAGGARLVTVEDGVTTNLDG